MGEMSGFENRLQSYSSTQLHELLEDDGKLREMVGEMEEMQDMQQNKELTIASNRSLAEQNLNLQPELDHQKIQLTKRYCCLQDLHESYQLRRSTLGNSSLDTLLALLQTEGAKIEEETENMADSFLDGSLPLDSFIDDYQSKRKLAHLRRVKIDKLQEMVLKGVHLPQGSSNEPSQPQETHNSTAPFQRLANGSPAHVRPAPTSQPSAMPYNLQSIGAPLPNTVPSYSCPYPQALPQGPGAGLPPRAGFIMQ
ncbi:VPS37B subunit of ESCRT-I b isoform X1 [Sinocyclocheilus rhinocerous]|uniref:VPS37B subunit of ESCRT-I b isoform X1 n=1 Tax=Sinocyclocheilus rhinocerous TaxID=307959 RepID=UPI0007B8E518|nr:PREDICTED: vacuolar protein sorting-associated protein 37B-like isoform X1 [Sinocyclocheilus rhinocerous]